MGMRPRTPTGAGLAGPRGSRAAGGGESDTLDGAGAKERGASGIL